MWTDRQRDRDTYSYIMNRQIFGTFHYEKHTHTKKVLIQIMCLHEIVTEKRKDFC